MKLFALLLTTTFAGSLYAQTWDETSNGGGDAGVLPGTAQVVLGEGPLEQITGNLAVGSDVDMFLIYISELAFFSASTSINPGTAGDTQLFLFDDFGFGIAFNDDQAATTRPALPVGNDLYNDLPAGFYLLAISRFDNDPSNSSGAIFPDTPFTAINGPTGAGGALAVTFWDSAPTTGGTYRITLTGAEYFPVGTFEGGNEGANEGGVSGGLPYSTGPILTQNAGGNGKGGGGGGCYAGSGASAGWFALLALAALSIARR